MNLGEGENRFSAFFKKMKTEETKKKKNTQHNNYITF